MEFLGTQAMIVAIEQGKTCNITSKRQRLKFPIEFFTHQPTHTALDSIQTGQSGLSCTCPDVTTVFHLRADLAFVEIEQGRRGQIFPRAVEGPHHLSSVRSHSQDVGVPFEVWCQLEPKKFLKAGSLNQVGTLHLHWGGKLALDGGERTVAWSLRS